MGDQREIFLRVIPSSGIDDVRRRGYFSARLQTNAPAPLSTMFEAGTMAMRRLSMSKNVFAAAVSRVQPGSMHNVLITALVSQLVAPARSSEYLSVFVDI